MEVAVTTASHAAMPTPLPKVPTGIQGFDEITEGGVPKGRVSLIAGSAGTGKTVFAMGFLVNGAEKFGDPGLFVSFEETPRDLETNFASQGFDLKRLEKTGLLALDHIRVERSEMEETGDYDLEGLFVRLGAEIDAIGAKRVVLDTIEVLFSAFTNEVVVRSEIKRLFQWLSDKGVTAIVTGESGERTITRHGLEEYVADFVVVFSHLVTDETATRRLRIVKYRGSAHGTNEFSFLIDRHGISVLPISSLGLRHQAPTRRLSSGLPRLDEMLEGKGVYQGSSVLVSGTAGTGKTSIAASFVEAACRRGEKALYFAFEESPDQIARNMRSIGLDLGRWVKKGTLRIHSERPQNTGLEMHLVRMNREIENFSPSVTVVDPITNLTAIGSYSSIRSTLTRMIDAMKSRRITAFFTSLTEGGGDPESTDVGVSSLMDTWILLRNLEVGGERTRGLYVLKSRGMAHSNQIREFVLSSDGVDLLDIYPGADGFLTGAARAAKEARERADALRLSRTIEEKQREAERKRRLMVAELERLKAQFEAEIESLENSVLEHRMQQEALESGESAVRAARGSAGAARAPAKTKAPADRRPQSRARP
jgi:circadian clock protein KaiC